MGKSWYDECYRKLFFDFHSAGTAVGLAAAFDAERWADRLLEANAQAVSVFTKCGFGYSFYRKGSVRYPHPHLPPGLDMLEEQIAALHRRGMKAIGYYHTFNSEPIARDHPDWIERNADGTTRGVSICLLSPPGPRVDAPARRGDREQLRRGFDVLRRHLRPQPLLLRRLPRAVRGGLRRGGAPAGQHRSRLVALRRLETGGPARPSAGGLRHDPCRAPGGRGVDQLGLHPADAGGGAGEHRRARRRHHPRGPGVQWQLPRLLLGAARAALRYHELGLPAVVGRLGLQARGGPATGGGHCHRPRRADLDRLPDAAGLRCPAGGDGGSWGRPLAS